MPKQGPLSFPVTSPSAPGVLGALDQGEVGKQLLSRVERTYSTWSQRFKERKGLVLDRAPALPSCGSPAANPTSPSLRFPICKMGTTLTLQCC